MAMTVTATMSGTAANQHIYLWIRVYTSAIEAGGASAGGLNAAGGTGVTASLTPAVSSSVPLFAITADNWGGSYTAAASNTIDSSSADSDTWGAGFGRYTGTVTGGVALTFGASGVGGGCDYSTWAAYEIQGTSGSPVLDGSSPALASATGAGIKTVTSASFTPPPGSVIAVLVCCGGTGSSGSMAMTITGTGGLTWTQRAAGGATVTAQDTFVFTATVPAATVPPASSPRIYAPGWHPGRGLPGMPGGTPFTPPRLAPPPGPATIAVTGQAGATGTVTALVTQGTRGEADGAGTAAGAAARYITGLAGTGAGYFADNTGSPRFLLADNPWALIANAGRWGGTWQSDIDTYCDNRGGQGFTAIYLAPLGNLENNGVFADGRTQDGVFPFTVNGTAASTASLSGSETIGLNATFWARVDYFLAACLRNGMTGMLNVAYEGPGDFAAGGAFATMTASQFGQYGAALAARYSSAPNIIWVVGNDYFGGTGGTIGSGGGTPAGDDSKFSSLLSGLRGGGDSHAITIHNFAESNSREDIGLGTAGTVLQWGNNNAQFNGVYSYNTTYLGIEDSYGEPSPIPVMQLDGYFYQGTSTYSASPAYDRAFRQDAWWAISSGARGVSQGSESIWQWPSTALAASGTDWFHVHNAANIRTLVESLPGWHLLIPDTSSVLVTSGRGTRHARLPSGGGNQYEPAVTDSYVSASRVADGSLAVIYLSHGTTITIDQTKMGAGYTAFWADPITGALTSTTAGSTYNSTAKGNNSQGDPDWVLILQATAVTGTATASAAATATGLVTEVVTATAAAAATATGTVTQGVTGTAAAASTAAGSVTEGVTGSAAAAGTATGLVNQAAVATAAAAGTAAGLVNQACTGEGDASATAAALVTQKVTATAAGQGSAAGAGSVAGSATAAGSAAAAGLVRQVVTGEGDGQAAAAGAGGAAGTATAAGAGTATGLVMQGVTAAATATSTAAGLVTQPATGEADGAGTATGRVQQGNTAAATASATAAGSGTSTSGQHGEGDGVSSVTAAAVQGNSAAAVAAAAAAGTATQQVTGTAAGAGTAAGLVTQTVTAQAAGVATAAGSAGAASTATAEADAASTAAGRVTLTVTASAAGSGTASGSSSGTTAGTATAAASASVAEAFTLTASVLAAELATATGSPQTSSPAAVLSGTATVAGLSGTAAAAPGPGGSAAASDLEGAASIG